LQGSQRLFGCLGVMYVGVIMLFAVSPDLPISFSNSVSRHLNWPVLPSVGERFWSSLALSVPGIRAVFAFGAARYPIYERVFIGLLQASLIIAAASFAFHFIFYERALLYAIGFGTELIQIVFYYFLMSRLKRRSQ
jgi:hypothetical protein